MKKDATANGVYVLRDNTIVLLTVDFTNNYWGIFIRCVVNIFI